MLSQLLGSAETPTTNELALINSTVYFMCRVCLMCDVSEINLNNLVFMGAGALISDFEGGRKVAVQSSLPEQGQQEVVQSQERFCTAVEEGCVSPTDSGMDEPILQFRCCRRVY